LQFNLYKCTGTAINPCSQDNLENISGNLNIFDYDDSSSAFQFNPTSDLENNTFYLAKIISAESLSGGVLNSEYSWQFETASNKCLIKNVSVSPRSARIAPSDNQDYLSSAISNNCAEIKSSDLSWQWSSDKTNIAKINSSNKNTAIAQGLQKGTTYIKAKTGDKENKAYLVVSDTSGELQACSSSANQCTADNSLCTNSNEICDTKNCFCISSENLTPLEVIFYEPNNTALNCTNAIIDIIFNQKVNHSSFTTTTLDNVKLLEGVDPVETQLNFYSVKSGTLGCTNKQGCEGVKILPKNILLAGQTYNLALADGKTGILAKSGALLSNDFGLNFSTSNTAKVCQINYIKINPDKHNFTTAGEEQNFLATAYSLSKEQIQEIIDVYEWTWSWSKNDKDNIVDLSAGNSEEKTKLTARNVNGSGYLISTATIDKDALNYTDGNKIYGIAKISTNLCLNPWPASGQPYIDKKSSYGNFSLFYCRDAGAESLCQDGKRAGLACVSDTDCEGGKCQIPADDLPELEDVKISTVPCIEDNCMREYLLFRKDESTDVIGIRVFTNPDYASVEDLYSKLNPDIVSPSYQKININGYSALRDDTTLYILVAAKVNFDNLYTNLHVWSYNSNASTETIDIFNKLISNLNYNRNLIDSISGCKEDLTKYCNKDLDCTSNICLDSKAKITRDAQRIVDLHSIKRYLDKYFTVNNFYPKLESGSYVIGQSTSKWPSWLQELSTELNYTLPIDPLNTFNVCPIDYDQESCWNKDMAPAFSCPQNSYIYQYISSNNGTNFNLYGNMEHEDIYFNLYVSDAWIDTANTHFTWNKNDTCKDFKITN